MRLSEILKPECIKVPLDATEKQAAIFELADLLAEVVGIADHDNLKQAVWKREMTRTTGIGHGIAIPHGKCSGVTQLQLAIGMPRAAIEFESIDRRPVDLIILLASPEDQTGPHIKALAQISRLLTDEAFRNQVKQAPDSAALFQLISDYEAQLAG